MTEPILLHQGFDNLDMAYRVQLPADLRNKLAAAKASAIEERRAVPLTYAGRTFLVEGHGGKGGYLYSVDTGVIGAVWWFKEPNDNRDPWGARVSSRALPLATKGIEAVKAEHDQFLIDLGMPFTEIDRRISRLDYAIDFYFPDFEINPAHFVCHSRKAKTIDGIYSANSRGDRITGIRIGTMPNAQIAIYDKRREVIDKKKFYWWEIWKGNAEQAEIQLTSKTPIWRFELRAGKSFLDKTYLRKTWEAIAANPSLVFEKIATQTRLTIPHADTNRARWPSAPIWSECQTHLSQIALPRFVKIDTEAIKAALWAEYLQTLSAQNAGLIISQMAAYGLERNDVPAMLSQLGLDVEDILENDQDGMLLAKRRAGMDARYGR
ncbi:hypothetical protein [Oceanicaulis sp.]|uniref:hypothetical protein n=1 Tax=Oceanicaulis sp. TaxID=1924941 RepID=UPI003D2E3CFE